MLGKCRGIVLGTVTYSESSLILKCYTDLYGLQSYLINGVKGKKGGIQPSQLMPLTLLELEAYHQQNKNLQRIKELRCTPRLLNLHFDVVKVSIGIFMAELIQKCLRDEQNPDSIMFDFLFHSIQILDLSEDNIANFPVYFMVQFSRYLGFFPKTDFSEVKRDFSLMEGAYVQDSPDGTDWIKFPVSKQFYNLTCKSFQEIGSLEINSSERKLLLEKVVRYFQLHIIPFGDLKSPDILHEVLN